MTLPLALRVLPPEQLGLYYTLVAVAGAALLLDMGIGAAITRSAGYAMAGASTILPWGVAPPPANPNGPNDALLSDLIEVSAWFYRGAALLAFVVLLLPGTLYAESLLMREGHPPSMFGIWWLLCLSTFIGLRFSYWSHLLVGVGLVKESARLVLLTQALTLLVTVVLLLAGAQLWSFAASGIAPAILQRFLAKRHLLGAHPRIDRRASTRLNTGLLATLLPMAWRQGVMAIGAFLILRSSQLVIGSSLPHAESASFGLSATLVSLILALTTTPVSVALPTINKLRATGDVAAISSLFLTRLYAGLAAAVVLLIALCTAGNDMLRLLGSGTFLLPPLPLAILCMVHLLEIHHGHYGSLVLTENRNPFMVPALASGIAIFFLAWHLAPQHGVMGVLLAQGAVQLAFNNWWAVLRGLKGLRTPPANRA